MKIKTKDLVYMAFYDALFMVLDYLTNMLGFLQMPKGGSVGLSTIALLACSYHLGWKKGVLVGIVSVMIQFVTGPMYIPDMLGFCMDYLIAFSVYGLASLFPNYGYVYFGVLVTNGIRFLSHTIGGIIVWEVDPWGSVVYNAPYMAATCVLGLVLMPFINERVIKKLKD